MLWLEWLPRVDWWHHGAVGSHCPGPLQVSPVEFPWPRLPRPACSRAHVLLLSEVMQRVLPVARHPNAHTYQSCEEYSSKSCNEVFNCNEDSSKSCKEDSSKIKILLFDKIYTYQTTQGYLLNKHCKNTASPKHLNYWPLSEANFKVGRILNVISIVRFIECFR